MSVLLGLSAFYHDSAAAIIVDGEIRAAAQEERFSRRKHDANFPTQAIQACLDCTGLKPREIDKIVFYDKPLIKFERLLETYLSFAPRGFSSFAMAIPVWLKDKLFQKHRLAAALEYFDADIDWQEKLLFSEHHLSHAASAFYPSPFEEAAVLTLDGVGEWATTTLGIGSGAELALHYEQHFPHSLGLLYSAFAYYAGFKVNSGEYKVMGLAPYGEPKYAPLILDQIMDLKPDGTFRLNLDFFNYCTGLTMTSPAFDRLFGGAPRATETELTQREMDLAASIQAVTEEVVLRLGQDALKRTGYNKLCLAGGVALNCVANGKLLRTGGIKQLWIQPAAGDAGGAVGAALAAWHLQLGGSRASRSAVGADGMKGTYLGPAYDSPTIADQLNQAGAVFEHLPDLDMMIARTVQALQEGCVVGWHQGRMEFGPRALGGRSILGDPRHPKMQKTMNLRVKFRESFRPFAPSILCEDVSDWFMLTQDSPYMLLVADIVPERRLMMSETEQALFGIDKLNIPRSEIPAVTHVDYSARIQTVHKKTNPRYHALLTQWKQVTGCPILVNTSFNIRGEPIVESPADAFRCFMGSDIEILVVGDYLLRKIDQDPALIQDYRTEFALD